MEDYRDAAARHFEDAKLLHAQIPPRLANASHLYGFAGECALKSIMAGKAGSGKTPHSHLPQIVSEFENHSAAKGNPRLLKSIKACCVGLTAWRVEERYYNRVAVTFQSDRVQSEADAAKRLLGLLALWKKGAI